MKNIRHELALWVQIGIAIGLWLLLVYISGAQPAISAEALSKIPEVVTIYGFLYLVFTRWLWRWRVFRGWLIPFPDLQGTWQGAIQTTWIDPATGASPGRVPATLVIKQTFSSIACLIYTAESESVSTAAAFHIDEESDAKSLAWVYTNTPRVLVRDRSTVHNGAATLRVSMAPELRLEGEYWTNRKTTGEMVFHREAATLADSFISPDRKPD